jgi:exodeoxyribonuclease VII large subunit
LAPLRIAVLASPDSDGWNDFHKELERSRLGFSVTLYAVRVQGDDLRPTMLKGLAYFAKRSHEHDVLCIVRGGGSRTDLAWFDDREVAMATAKHPLKILCGIGHERDQSVLDLIAHSEKTPTAVGACVVARVEEEVLRLDQRGMRLLDLSGEAVKRAREALAAHGQCLREVVRARLDSERHSLAERSRRLLVASASLVRGRRGQVAHAAARLGMLAGAACGRERLRLEKHEARQRLLDPESVLRRGYVIVRKAGGRIVTQAAAVAPGELLDLQFRDGRVAARTEQGQIDSEA